MTVALPNKSFRYGQHEIPLGKPYSYMIDDIDHTITLHSYGGMGLESSKIHEVTFCFPAEIAEKANEIVAQLLQYMVSPTEGTYYNESAALMQIFGNNENNQAYQVTKEKVLKSYGYVKHMQRIDKDNFQVVERYDFGRDLGEEVTELPSLHKQMDEIKGRVDFILEQRPDLPNLFLRFTQQLALMRSLEKITHFALQILMNSLEISVLKYFLGIKEWSAFQKYIWSNAEEGLAVALGFRVVVNHSKLLCCEADSPLDPSSDEKSSK